MALIVIRDEEEAAARQAIAEAARFERERLERLAELVGPPHPIHSRWRYHWDEGEVKTRAPAIYCWRAERDDGVEVRQTWWSSRQRGAFGKVNPMLPWTNCPEAVMAEMRRVDEEQP